MSAARIESFPKTLVLLLGPFLFAQLAASVAVYGRTTPRFAGDPLLLGAGARALGMGNAFVSISDDATAVYWNPAGLARLKRNESQVQHAERFGGTVKHDVITAAGPSPVGGFGIGLLRLGVEDIKLTTLEDPSESLSSKNRAVVSSEVGTSDTSLHLCYGRAVRPGIYLGTTLKLIWRNLAAGDGSGYGIDVGALYVPVPAWSLGLTVRNVTRTRIRFDTGSTDRIPPSIWVGGAYRIRSQGLHGRLLFAASIHLFEEDSGLENLEGVQLGGEYLYRERLAFRFGTNGSHWTAGAGVRVYDRLAFDLAFLEHNQLENTYQISASFFF